MRARDMTRGRPGRLILSFALPLMAGSVFQQAYTLTDLAIVGKFVGVEALAAVGVSDWYNWMMLSVVIGFTQGFSILMSQYFGAGDARGLKKAFAMSVFLSALTAAAGLMLGQGMAVTVLKVLRTPENIFDNALLYIRVCFSGIPVITGYNLLAGALRALGDSRTPLAAIILSSLINIALDFLFVVGAGLGIAGAAAATVIAQTASMIYCLFAVRRAAALHPTGADWKIDRPLCSRLIKLGAPIALQNGVISCGGMAVQRVVNRFGFLFIAGYTATNKLYGILELAAIAFGGALSVYTGQNMGARQYARIRAGVREATKIFLGTSAVICALMLLLGKPILSLFIEAPPEEYARVMGYAFDYLTLMSLCLPILYMLYVYRSALQGMGDTVIPMVSGFVELAMRVSAAVLLTGVIGEYGAYVAEVAAWTGAATLLGIAYFARAKRMPGENAPLEELPLS